MQAPDGTAVRAPDPLEALIAAVRRERRRGEPLEQAIRRVWVHERDRLDWATITAFRRAGEAVLGPEVAIQGCPTTQGDYLALVGFVAVVRGRIDPAS